MILCCGVILGTAGYSAASLAFTHQKPEASSPHPRCDKQKHLETLINVPCREESPLIRNHCSLWTNSQDPSCEAGLSGMGELSTERLNSLFLPKVTQLGSERGREPRKSRPGAPGMSFPTPGCVSMPPRMCSWLLEAFEISPFGAG